MCNPESTFSTQLQITLLGPLQIEYIAGETRRSIHLPSGQAANLLGYLAFHAPAFSPRGRLACLLNPDLPEAVARRTLTNALYRLRCELGDASGWVLADTEAIWLETHQLQVDVHAYSQYMTGSTLESWQRAVDLYAGDLLEEQDAEWLLAPRATLREVYLSGLERLCDVLVKANRLSEALSYTHRWTLADPLCEEAYHLIMQLYMRLGYYAAALEQYDRLTQLLADELDARPLARTRLLAESIRAEYSDRQEPAESRNVFVGRRTERARLLAWAEEAQASRGGLALVEGEPGIGKTCLLEEFAKGAAWRGLTVAWGRAREMMATTLYSPCDQALQAALVGPRLDQVRACLDPETLQIVAYLVPRLPGKRSLPADPPINFSTPPDLPAAVGQVLTALADIAPHVFIFDDVQWAGSGFWDVMQTIAPLLSIRRILIILCYRGEELRENSIVWTTLCRLDRTLSPPKLLLNGLALQECLDLAQKLDADLNPDSALALLQRTGGNPLFLSEALKQPDHVPVSFRAVLDRHWAGLPPEARSMLQAAAVLGREFKCDTWLALGGPNLLREIPLLVAMRFIVETEQGYVFQHDLTREYVYANITDEDRHRLHRCAGEVLLKEGAAPDVLAWHFERAEVWSEAVRYCRESGERAQKAFAYAAALDHFTHALELLSHLDKPEAERLVLLRLQQQTLGSLVDIPRWLQSVEALDQAARAAGDDAALLEALTARVYVCVFMSDWACMQTTAVRAIALAEKIGDRVAEARLRELFGFHLCDALGQDAAAREQLERAVELAEASGEIELLAESLIHLAYVDDSMGLCRAGCAMIDRALDLCEKNPALRASRVNALAYRGLLQADLAEWESARAGLCVVVEEALKLGHMRLLGEALWDLATVCSRMGQHAEARHAVDTYLAKFAELGGTLDSMYGHWIVALSGNLYLRAGDLPQAEYTFSELQPWMDTEQTSRALSTALCGLGQLLLAQERACDARVPLERAAQIWQTMPNSEVGPLVLHALAEQRCGNTALARLSLGQAESFLQQGDAAQFNVWLNYVRYECSSRPEDLAAARAEIQRQAALFTDEKLRADFLTQVQLHREIEARWQALQPVCLVRLALTDARLGKALSEADYVTVRWTVDAGEPDADILRREGKAALRRCRLRRLLDEAHTQGAAPTDADLARVLGVDRRTILRDMTALRQAGQTTPTRRRKHLSQ